MQSFIERCRPLYQYKGFRLMFVLNLLMGMAYSFVGPFMSMFGTKEAGMSTSLFGVFMTIIAVVGIVIGTVLAHYSDTHFSRRFVLLLGSAMGALGYLGFAYVRSFVPLLLIGSVVLGIGGTTFSQIFAYARELLQEAEIPKDQGAFYMNAFRMYVALAWTVGPAIGSLVMLSYSYKGLFLCAAACFVLLMIVVWFFVPSGPPSAAGTKAGSDSSVLSVIRRTDVLAHFSAFVLILAAATIGMMNLPLMILNALGGNEGDVGITYCVAPLFELPLMLYFGILATRHSPAKLIRFGIMIAVAYYGLLTFVQAPWHVYPLQILSAAVTAVTAGLAITYFQSHLPHHPGTATNLYSNASRLGSTLGYFLFGALSWRFSHRMVFLVCTVFAIASLLLMLVPTREEAGAEGAQPST